MKRWKEREKKWRMDERYGKQTDKYSYELNKQKLKRKERIKNGIKINEKKNG